MPSRTFLKFATRLRAYDSVMRWRFRDVPAQDGQPVPEQRAVASPQAAYPAPPSGRGEVTVVPATKAVVGADPNLSRLISFA